MKKITVTFHMKREHEVNETCTTLLVKDELAADALKYGVDAIILLRDALKHIAALQGCRYIEACYLSPQDVEEVEA